jgi:uncharacterized protein (TIGR00251 family)
LATEKPYSVQPFGLRLAIRLTPRASRNGVDGTGQGADGKSYLQIRLNAPPVDGTANRALIEFLADALDMRKSDIVIHSGETSRLKILYLAGNGTSLVAKIEALL